MSVADSTMTRTKAFPAAGASNQIDSVDLGADRVGAIGHRMALHLVVPDLPSLADGETMEFTLQDSADDSSWADVVTLDAAKRTGAGGSGDASTEFRLYLPPDTRRYLRIQATASATAGDNTGESYTVEFRI